MRKFLEEYQLILAFPHLKWSYLFKFQEFKFVYPCFSKILPDTQLHAEAAFPQVFEITMRLLRLEIELLMKYMQEITDMAASPV